MKHADILIWYARKYYPEIRFVGLQAVLGLASYAVCCMEIQNYEKRNIDMQLSKGKKKLSFDSFMNQSLCASNTNAVIFSHKRKVCFHF